MVLAGEDAGHCEFLCVCVVSDQCERDRTALWPAVRVLARLRTRSFVHSLNGCTFEFCTANRDARGRATEVVAHLSTDPKDAVANHRGHDGERVCEVVVEPPAALCPKAPKRQSTIESDLSAQTLVFQLC